MIGVLLATVMATPMPWLQPKWSDAGGRLEVAARMWEEPEGSPRIWLVGVTHMGEPSYYAAIETLLEQCDVVVFESVLPEGGTAPGGSDDTARADSTQATAALLAKMLAGTVSVDWNQAIENLAASNTRVVSIVRPLARDGWGRSWVMRDNKVTSFGADGMLGGTGVNADIVVAVAEEAAQPNGGELQRSMAESLGLVFQLDSLPYDGVHWVPGDLRVDQVAAAFKERGEDLGDMTAMLSGGGLVGGVMSGVFKMIPVLDALFGGRIVDTIRVILIEMLGDEALIGSALEMQGPALEEVLLDLRNERAMEVLWEQLAELDQGQTIALVYGAGHLPGLVTILQSHGDWEVADTQWLPAIEFDLTTSPLTKSEVDMLRGWIRNFAKRLSPR
jgi:hypothetical protein